MDHRMLLAVGWLALSLAACAGNQRQNAPANAPQNAAALANETGLPLPENAAIIDAHPFSQTIETTQTSGSSLAAAGKGTYSGHEVIASSPRSEQDLAKWLASVPVPQGMVKIDQGAKIKVGADSLDSIAHRYGIDYIAFSSPRKGATVVVMDPKLVASKLGIVLSLVDKYNALPGPMKSAMDSQIKQRTGFTIEELTDKSAPLGAAISAINEFRNTDKRAVILVSAEKVP